MITIKMNQKTGAVKPMHAVNNGPFEIPWQKRSDVEAYRAAGIPYARNHDAAFCDFFGGAHSVDIHGIFSDFNADPLDPASYDFIPTDAYLKSIEAVGTETFYRLGSKIEHSIEKYGTKPPKDFAKWAVICEHVIRHYNEGWADGFHMNLKYWEIWNEADMAPGDPNSPTWGGTPEEFYELYAITATHLKKAFPDLKIGGPASADLKNQEWLEGFFQRLTRDEEKVPLDFFSWHHYFSNPDRIVEMAGRVQELLNRYGYPETESILDEWNYVDEDRGWTDNMIPSMRHMVGIKGAAMIASAMCRAQDAPIDMLMYYDARPCSWNGMFDQVTLKPLKGYYPFRMFNDLYRKGAQVGCDNDVDGIDVVSAADGAGNVSAMLVYYDYPENGVPKRFQVRFEGLEKKKLKLYLVDSAHDGELVKEIYMDTAEIEMTPNSVLLISTDYEHWRPEDTE